MLNHELNHNWHLLSGFAYRDSSFEGQSSDTELSEGRQLLYTDPSILSRQRRTRDYQAQDLSLRFELSGVVDVAGFVNNVLFGLDYYNYHIDTDYRRWRTACGIPRWAWTPLDVVEQRATCRMRAMSTLRCRVACRRVRHAGGPAPRRI